MKTLIQRVPAKTMDAGNGRRFSDVQRKKREVFILMKSTQEIWREGFRAGQIVVGQCPYPLESPEARVWHNGYGLGLFKGESPCGVETEPVGVPNRWRALLHRFLGH